MVVGFTTTYAIVSSNLDQGDVYNIMFQQCLSYIIQIIEHKKYHNMFITVLR